MSAAADPRAVIATFLAGEPLFAHFGIEVIDVGAGSTRLRMAVRADMVNANAVCHGGMVYLLADSALGLAANSHNQRAVSSACAIDYLLPARPGDVLTATAEERSRTRRSGLYDVRVENQAGELVALLRGRTATIAGTHLPAA